MDLRLRSLIAAVRAAIAAQVAVGHVVVDVLVLAADAVRRIGELVDPVVIDGRIDAEEHHRVRQHVMKRRAQRVVRVHAERRVLGVFNADADVLQRMRDLTIAVELVAEDVRHHDGLRVNKFRDGLERRLVRLNERVRIAALARQRRVHGKLRRHAAEQICAGLVGKERNSSVRPRLLDHARRRGLAVGARNDHGRYVLRQIAQQVRTDLERHAPGKVGSASAQQTDQRPAALARKHREKHLDFHATVIPHFPVTDKGAKIL